MNHAHLHLLFQIQPHEEAISKQDWREAMQEELIAIERNQTKDLVNYLKG